MKQSDWDAIKHEKQLQIMSGQANNMAFEWSTTRTSQVDECVQLMKEVFPVFFDHLKECSETVVQSHLVTEEVIIAEAKAKAKAEAQVGALIEVKTTTMEEMNNKSFEKAQEHAGDDFI